MTIRVAVEELVYRSCLLLDAGDYAGFLELCHPEFRYVVEAFGPEIRRNMVWLDHDRPAMETLFRNLPRHHSELSPLSRHATVYAVTIDERQGEAQAVSALQVFQTALDGGVTTLFAVGKIYDTAKLESGATRLLKRTLRLDTRMLGIGSHIPL
jgi:methanesulfonate monooxygenase small subunit